MYVYCGIIIFITHRHLSHSSVDKTRFSVHKFTEWLCTNNWFKKRYVTLDKIYFLSGRVVWTTWDRTRTAMAVASARSNPGQAPSLRYTVLCCTVLSVLYCTVLYCTVYSREHLKTFCIQVSRSTPCRSKLFKFFLADAIS